MPAFLDQLKRLHAAEDFFRALDVPYDPKVLHVARLHILRRMGQSIASLDGGEREETVRETCRAALMSAYTEFTNASPIETRLFKVHRDRDPEAGKKEKRPFVPFSSLLDAGA